MKLLIILILELIAVSVKSSPAKIDFQLRKSLEENIVSNVFVHMKSGTASVLDSVKKLSFSSRGEKLSTLKSSLKSHAIVSQKNVINILLNDHHSDKYRGFWINNQIYIQDASLELLEKIAALNEVSYLVEEQTFEIVTPIHDEGAIMHNLPDASNIQWGVSKVQAPEVWGLDGGNNGKDIRVATIDTGVRGTHEALNPNFLGAYGWYDPYKGSWYPNDENGHGTHTTGIIAGQNGIGVAPGSKWLACKGCATSICEQFALISCGQFMLCPTDPIEEKEDCGMAPHLISNSWGGGQGRDMFHEVIDAWNIAGIIGVFANGNSGPSCGTANSPADHPDVIAVGSTTSADKLSIFSSLGPSAYGTMKPDVAAPGSSVNSAYHTSNDAYTILSGTSMACPHASGVIALLLARNQNLTLSEVRKHLIMGADQSTLVGLGENCEGIPETEFPNHSFGYGRVNALKSILNLINEEIQTKLNV